MAIMAALEQLDNHCPIFEWNSACTESINFQANSSFPKELTEQMQKVLDFCSKHDEEFGEVTNNDEASRKHLKVQKFIQGDIASALKKIIKKHTKVDVHRFVSELPLSTDQAMAIFVGIPDPDKVLLEVIAASSGTSDALFQGELHPKTKKRVEDLVNLSKSLNKSRGKILGSLKSLKFFVGLPVGVFTVKDYVRKGEQFQMTAAEITATLLHEIGHIFSWVEKMGDLSYTGYYGNHVLNSVDERMDNDPNFVSDVIGLTKDTSQQSSSPVSTKLMSNLLSFIEAVNTEVGSQTGVTVGDTVRSKYSHYFLTRILRVLTRICITICLIYYAVILIPAAYVWVTFPSGVSTSSRERSTNKSNTMFERLADEYVSRYKMSKDLNQALNKLNQLNRAMYSLGYGDPVFSKWQRESLLVRGAWYILTQSPATHFVFNIYKAILEPSSSYEEDFKRLQRNITNLMDILKDSKIDPEIRRQLINDIETMQKTSFPRSTKAIRLFWKTIRFISVTPISLLANSVNQLAGDAGERREYFQLFEDLDDQLSNKGFYHAAKIKNIFEA